MCILKNETKFHIGIFVIARGQPFSMNKIYQKREFGEGVI